MKRILTANRPYHVTARTNNKEWFSLPIHEVWDVFLQVLAETSNQYGLRVMAFVLMDNHYHLLADTPLANLDQCMKYLQREVSKIIGFRSGRINHLFGGPYSSSLIVAECYFLHAYKYVYRNPVDGRIVEKVEDYPYSTWNAHLPFALHDDLAVSYGRLPPDRRVRLDWLNRAYRQKEREVIRRALKRKKFCFTKDKTFRQPVLNLYGLQIQE